jgi:hypothetical protein
MQRRAVKMTLTDVSEVRTASIIRAERLKMIFRVVKLTAEETKHAIVPEINEKYSVQTKTTYYPCI